MNNLFKLFRMRHLWRPKWAAFFMFVIFGMFLLLPNISIAAVNLPWSTTFNCPDWTQSNGIYNVNCDGLTGHGTWVATDNSGSYEEQITSPANYPGGAGGRGQRNWKADGYDNNSGGLKITFNSPQSELWIRWYMRYELGFQWNPLVMNKILYLDPGAIHAVIPEFYGNEMNIAKSNAPNNQLSTGGKGWNAIMGGATSDGQWHLYEIHIKMDTNGADGIAEFWVDNVRVLYYNNSDYGTAQGWSSVVFGSNQLWPANGRAMYVDFDDIVVSTTGPIGGSIPISTSTPSDTTSPSIPSSLSAAAISTSQINLSWTASTDNIGVSGYRIYRCQGTGCVPTTQIATSATNSYSNTGLTANTTYVYRIAAYDAAGNVSAQSSSVSATTQAVADTTPPAAPTGLIVQ